MLKNVLKEYNSFVCFCLIIKQQTAEFTSTFGKADDSDGSKGQRCPNVVYSLAFWASDLFGNEN